MTQNLTANVMSFTYSLLAVHRPGSCSAATVMAPCDRETMAMSSGWTITASISPKVARGIDAITA